MDLAGCAQARGKTEGWQQRRRRGRVGATGGPERDGFWPESVTLGPFRGEKRRPWPVPRHLAGAAATGSAEGEGFGRSAVTLGVFRATRVTEWPEGESLSVRGILPWDVLRRACHGETRRRKPRHSHILPWAVPRRRTSPLAGFTPLAGRSCRGRPRGRRNRGRKRLPWSVPRRKASPLGGPVAPGRRACHERARGRRNRARKRHPWPSTRQKTSPLARSVAPGRRACAARLQRPHGLDIARVPIAQITPQELPRAVAVPDMRRLVRHRNNILELRTYPALDDTTKGSL